MKNILVTAFEPFGGEAINPTGLILSSLPDEIAGVKLVKLLLPVEFIAAPELVRQAIEACGPAAVIMLGQAGGRSAVTPERVAINVMDARMPDNAGFMPQDEPIAPGGAAAYFATLPVRRLVERLTAEGVPASVSNSAGTYVCNAVMYGALSRLYGAAEESGGEVIPAGFVHFPFIREQTAGKRPEPPFMELEAEVAAARTIIAETVNIL